MKQKHTYVGLLYEAKTKGENKHVGLPKTKGEKQQTNM